MIEAAGAAPASARVGVERVDRIVAMENHDEAYGVWRDAGVRRQPLVHIDAHHDMWWIPAQTSRTIANFICSALRDDLVSAVYWVVPDRTWTTARGRRALARHLRALCRQYPRSERPARTADERLSAVVLDKPLVVCSLASLPSIGEPVLLDIDVDYLVIPEVVYGESDRHGLIPWCWPSDLVARLAAREVRAPLATIAYSVGGGFTPLAWKYLGDELALRLGAEAGSTALRGMDAMREAALAVHDGAPARAEARLGEATTWLPRAAAPRHHLARLRARAGRVDEARALYQEALALEPSYRTAYNSFGFHYHGQGRYREADAEHRRTLALDPDDAYAYYGLARLAARERRWAEAERLLGEALARRSALTDAWRLLGRVLERQRRLPEAVTAYERSLRLALAGHALIDEPIATFPDGSSEILDPGHGPLHARLARLCELGGRLGEARAGYRISIAGGYDGVLLRARLARLEWRQGHRREAGHEAWRAAALVPRAIRTTARRWRRAMARALTARG